MNTKNKPMMIVRNPFTPRTFQVKKLGFMTLVSVGSKLDGGQVYAGTALSRIPKIYSKLENYINKRFPEFGPIE